MVQTKRSGTYTGTRNYHTIDPGEIQKAARAITTKFAEEPKTNIGEQNKFAGAFIKRGRDRFENYA